MDRAPFKVVWFVFAPLLTSVLLANLAGIHRPITAFVHSLLNNAGLAAVHSQPPVLLQPPYVLFSARVLLASGAVRPAYVSISATGKIESIQPSLLGTSLISSRVVVDVSPLVIMPGLIDPHVHVNAPGRESWEGFDAASRAATAGGTTTIIDMPLNNIPSTVSKTALAAKVKTLASSHAAVDIGMIGGIIPENLEYFDELVTAGVVALKSFMVDSQSPDFPHVSRTDLERAIKRLDEIATNELGPANRIPYILHAELQEEAAPNSYGDDGTTNYDHTSYEDYEQSRPPSWETNAVRHAIETANNSNTHIHIAHVSSHDVVRIINDIRTSESLQIAKLTAETCPHYLLWASDEIPSRATLFKCSPPIRPTENRKQMLESVFRDSTPNPIIGMIVSDHSPCPIELKALDGNFSKAWGGISGLQYRLQGSWTAAQGVNSNFAKLSELLSTAPARTFGLDKLKGSIKPGLDADFVIWDPDGEQEITAADCFHRHKASPYHGLKLKGVVHHTLVRGSPVYSRNPGSERSSPPLFGIRKGKLLVRSPHTGAVSAINPAEWQVA